MRKIKWIHFSDLHLNKTGVETNRLRKKLIEYLRSQNLHCDYVFFSGDVRFAPLGSFPADAVAYLQDVCNAVNVPLERLFVVPGNHDVNRSCLGREEAIHRIYYQGQGYYNPMQGDLDQNDLNLILEGEQEFYAFTDSLYEGIPNRSELYRNRQHPHFCITTDELNIIHVDSTLLYSKGQDRDLILGTQLLVKALEEADTAKPTILLTHYSYDYLHRNEQNQILQLMQDYKVQLWLAGHEHDHLCRPQRGYFQECQCGNLLLEDGAKSCVLIGDMDLNTGECELKSHAWFPQGGWAQYPFIRTGTEDNSIYPFVLRLPGIDVGFDASAEEKNILAACEALAGTGGPFSEVEFRKELIPDLQWDAKTYQNIDDHNPLMDVISSMWEEKQKDYALSWHALLLGDGGMGKSTMLFQTCKQLIRQHRLTVYTSVNMLQVERLTIEERILRTVYKNSDSATKSKFIRLISDACSRPELILLIDGFNELDSEAAYRYAAELKQLALYPGIQIIVSSRLDFLRYYGMSHFQMIRTCELRDEQISVLFSKQLWEEILSRQYLHFLLKNPMMALLYAQTSPIIEKYKDLNYCDWILPVSNVSDLMHNYYLAQVALTLERGNDGGNSVYVNYCAIKYILPYLAYHAERENCMSWSYLEFDKLFADAIQDSNDRIFDRGAIPENLPSIKRYYRVLVEHELPKDAIDNSIISELCLIRDNGKGYAFNHQIYRDYLAAVYLYDDLVENVGISNRWKDACIHGGVVQYLRYMHHNVWEEQGFIPHRLDFYRGVVIGENDYYVQNLLNCWLSEEVEIDQVRDLSNLDLRKIPLARHLKQRMAGTILIEGAKVSKTTFVNDRRHDKIVDLTFSHDGRMLAAVSSNGIISVSNILTQSQMIVGEINLDKDIAVCYTEEDCLQLKTGEKVYEWQSITYDKYVQVDSQAFPVKLMVNNYVHDPADVLYQLLEDSDMLGTKAVISEDRQFVAVGYHSGHIQIWDAGTQRVIAELNLGDEQVVDASFSPNGNIAAVTAGGALVQLWNIKHEKCRGLLHFEKPVRRVRFPATMDFAKDPLLECEYSDGHCFQINILTGEFSEYTNSQKVINIQKKIRSMLKGENIKKIDVGSNGNAVVQLKKSNRLFVWNQKTNTLNQCNGHELNVIDAAICTADPRYAASYSDEQIYVKGKDPNHLNRKKVIRVWAIRKGNCMQRLPTNQRTIKRIQFFTSNRIILAGFASNGDIMLWELLNKMVHGEERGHWNLIDTVRGNSAAPLECAVATQEKTFVGVNADGTMFSRTFTGQEKKKFKVFPGIDLKSLSWESLECDDELKKILRNYKGD